MKKPRHLTMAGLFRFVEGFDAACGRCYGELGRPFGSAREKGTALNQ